jgi:hypothetical protein
LPPPSLKEPFFPSKFLAVFLIVAGRLVELVKLDDQVLGRVSAALSLDVRVVVRAELVGEELLDLREDLGLDLLGNDRRDLVDRVVDGLMDYDACGRDGAGSQESAEAGGEEHADDARRGGGRRGPQFGDDRDLAAEDQIGAVVQRARQVVAALGERREVLGGELAPAFVDRRDRLALALARDDVGAGVVAFLDRVADTLGQMPVVLRRGLDLVLVDLGPLDAYEVKDLDELVGQLLPHVTRPPSRSTPFTLAIE